MPTSRKIQPMMFLGTREAVKAPTKVKAMVRKGVRAWWLRKPCKSPLLITRRTAAAKVNKTDIIDRAANDQARKPGCHTGQEVGFAPTEVVVVRRIYQL
jgi:hypothetical protein